MGFARTVTGLGALGITAFYLMNSSSLTSNFQWICIAAIIVLTFAWITMGSPKKQVYAKARPDQRIAVPIEEEGQSVGGNESEIDIPEPITENELDGATLRERKLAKIQSAQAKKEEVIAATLAAELDTSGEEIVEVTVEVEDVHVADEFVVEVSPESVENADI